MRQRAKNSAQKYWSGLNRGRPIRAKNIRSVPSSRSRHGVWPRSCEVMESTDHFALSGEGDFLKLVTTETRRAQSFSCFIQLGDDDWIKELIRVRGMLQFLRSGSTLSCNEKIFPGSGRWFPFAAVSRQTEK